MKEGENDNQIDNNRTLNHNLGTSPDNLREVNIDEETQALLEKKTENLENIFVQVKQKINSLRGKKKTIYDKEYIEQSNDSQFSDEKKKEIREFNSFPIYIFGFFCFSFYLVGIFQLIDLFDAAKKEMTIAFKSLFYNQTMEDQENFNELFVNSCFKNIPEFDFAFMTSFIGSFPLKYFGFFLSSLILTIGNIILIFIYGKFNFGKINGFSDFLFLLIYLIGYYILFGAVSLFSHEVIFEGFSDYDKIKKKHEENNNNSVEQNIVNIQINYNHSPQSNSDRGQNSSTRNNNSGGQNDHNGEEGNARIAENDNEEVESNQKYFKILCFGIMLAYLINKGINIILYHYFLDKYFDNLINFCIIIYGLSYCLSLIFYLLFYYQLINIKYLDNQLEQQKERNNYSKIYRICGYLLYYDERRLNDSKNNTNIKIIKYQENNNDNNNITNDISKTQNNEDKEETENNNNNLTYLSLICPNYKKSKNKKYCCASYKLGFRKFFYRTKNSISH